MKSKATLFSMFKIAVAGMAAMLSVPVSAQNPDGELTEVSRDTTLYEAPTRIRIERDFLGDPQRVVTNRFGKDWFFYGSVGAHTFRGDWSHLGGFMGTVSPEFEIGVGKWFTPGMALRIGAIRSNTKGYTIYGNDLQYKAADGTEYNPMDFGWWDFNAGAELNLSRLFMGYEGYGSRKLMNQLKAYAGIGIVHHTGFGGGYGSSNELSAHTELQYSRFFSTKKRVSLDLKLRGIFYQSNHDGEYGQADHAAKLIDANLGATVGLTIYLGRGWNKSTTRLYQQDYREQQITVVKERVVTQKEQPKIEQGTFTFYVFYPNNYSGRNDAPLVADAAVNAIDYLAGGIFTQKRYVNNGAVASNLIQGRSLDGLAIEDIPTESASADFSIDYVPRGYEMQKSAPMSLSLDADDMASFREKAGWYYAPVYDGKNKWLYRIDNVALGQNLLNNANYAETESFGLNSHGGLEIIRSHMDIDKDDELISFADMYAAINENEGFISGFTDAETVERIKHVLADGVITMIQAEGLATSQDNYSGANAARIISERNTALSQNRANTVIDWLKENERMEAATSQIYLVNSLNSSVRSVTDQSTRGLNAKLNRCVKVRVHYMVK